MWSRPLHSRSLAYCFWPTPKVHLSAARFATLLAATALTGGLVSAQSEARLPPALLQTDLKGLKKLHSGKVRDVYEVDSETVLLVATDRVRSTDGVVLNGIPYKGKIMTQLTVWWFNFVAKELGMPHHLLTADVDQMPAAVQLHAEEIRGRCMLAKKLEMIPVEFNSRGYITGPALQEYYKTGKFAGTALPLGLRDCDKLASPLFTASTKATPPQLASNLSSEECVERLGWLTSAKITVKCARVYERARRYCESNGIILADTKLEFGIDKTGEIVLAGEILTPDCSRFWEISSYEPGKQQETLDNQLVVDYLASLRRPAASPSAIIPDHIVTATLDKYLNLCIILTGQSPVL